MDPDAPRLECPALDRDLPNSYWFLRHRWDALAGHVEHWAASITHGDLNLNNILFDERNNIYVIDFSETRIRNVASDFARLEPLVMLQWTRIAGAADAENVLRAIDPASDRSIAGSIWDRPPEPIGS
ncbi:MAG: phosphotransferase, partial [Deltaproteobacteria bacterium]